MKTEPKVSIVLVNYNQREYTAQCLDSIRSAQLAVSHEVVLVDNASCGDDADWLGERYPEIVLVRSTENRGIAGGNNLGIRAGHSRYVLLLNNDTIVLPGSIEAAAHFLDAHPEAAGVGGNLLNPDGTFQASYNSFPTLWQELLHATGLGRRLRPTFPSAPRAGQTKEVDWIGTAFMLFRRDALEAIGLVDERFFIYSDETDLQYRLRKAGWAINYLPELETIHFGGKSLEPWKRRRLIYRGHLLFFSKHKGRMQTVLLRILFAAVAWVKTAVWWVAGLVPSIRQRAQLERRSNLEIFHLCRSFDPNDGPFPVGTQKR